MSSVTANTVSPARNGEAWFLRVLFVLALAYNLWGVSYHWKVGFLSGHEFRQTQTAIISYYIDKDDNFSLLYETPILGKPWVSNLMEVPIYEWGVVLLSRATGWPHHISARTISAVSFYAMLPAIYLLLGRLAVPKPRRLLVLALVLAAPLYIYYTRAFLMDSLALCGSVWFLLGFVRTMDQRSFGWLAVTIICGTVAALVKSATLGAWLVPGAAYGAWVLWRDVRARTGWKAPLGTLAWGLGTVVVPLGLLRWWVMYTDPIKEAHAAAWVFSSKVLVQGNWGLFDLKAIFSGEVWSFWVRCWELAIISRWLIAGGLLLGLALPTVRWRVLGLGALFFVAQFMFPYAYAYQDYYYYSCALYVLAALGFVLIGLLDSRLPGWLVALVCLVPFAVEVNTYRRGFYPEQNIVFDGDQAYTAALRELTPPNTVLVVAGADWASMTPYYAQRKALMVLNGWEFKPEYLRRAFKDLADENVSAVLLFGNVRTNQDFLNMAAARFDVDARKPTFSTANGDVYVARPYAGKVRAGLQDRERFKELTVHAAPEEGGSKSIEVVTPEIAQGALAAIKPAPYQMRFFMGGAARQGPMIVAQPNSDVWLVPPPNATGISWGFGIFPGAYEKPEAHSDGVEFSVWVQQADGQERRIYRRLLDPWNESADRGDQHAQIPYTPQAGDRLRFSSGPGGGSAFDWSYWIGIEVK